jgi:hypothetical protein
MMAHSASLMIAETRKLDSPRSRRFWFGLVGLFLPIGALVLALVLANLVHPGMAVFAIPVFILAQIWFVETASTGHRSGNAQAKESTLAVFVFLVVFAVEAVSIGFFLVGQVLALLVPFLIGNNRSWKGIERASGLNVSSGPDPLMECQMESPSLLNNLEES